MRRNMIWVAALFLLFAGGGVLPAQDAWPARHVATSIKSTKLNSVSTNYKCLPGLLTGQAVNQTGLSRQADPLEIIAFDDCAPRSFSQSMISNWMRQGVDDLPGERVGIEEIDQQAILLVLDHFTHGRRVRPDDETAGGHCFKHRP